jgi:hypothetical protein
MPAKHTVDLEVPGIPHNSLLETADKADNILYLRFHIRTKRPIAETEAAPAKIDQTVTAHEKPVAEVSKMREPPHILHHGIELVPVHHQQSAAVRSQMNGVFLNYHAAIVAPKPVKKLIMVPDNIDDLGAFAPFAQKLLKDIVVFLRPINRAPHRPDVDQITNDVERLKFGLAEKVQQLHRLAPSRPQVHVRNPTGSIILHDVRVYSQVVHSDGGHSIRFL